MGWLFGFKRHVVVNDRGGLLAFKLTAGNINDRVPLIDLCQGLWGKMRLIKHCYAAPTFPSRNNFRSA